MRKATITADQVILPAEQMSASWRLEQEDREIDLAPALRRSGLPIHDFSIFKRPLEREAVPATRELHSRTPFGYQFAESPVSQMLVADPAIADDPARAPTLTTHTYIDFHTGCNGHIWVDTNCGPD